jgi:hypothetical protein
MRILFLFSLIVLTAGIVSAQECFPQYICSDWSKCDDGLQTRTCTDSKCGRRDLVERQFCIPGCTPEITCDSWSQCAYTDKTQDIFEGKFQFGGYRSRFCYDQNGCVESFTEEGICGDSTDLDLVVVKECGVKYLAALDPASKRPIAKIDLESWKEEKFDLVFTQQSEGFCPSCYNGIKDLDEQELDCGGPCKPCSNAKTFPIKLLGIGAGVISGLFIVLGVREIILSLDESDTDNKEVFSSISPIRTGWFRQS